jgi:hypothetical protein
MKELQQEEFAHKFGQSRASLNLASFLAKTEEDDKYKVDLQSKQMDYRANEERLLRTIQEARRILHEEIDQANSTREEIITLETGKSAYLRRFEETIKENKLDPFCDNVYEDYNDFKNRSLVYKDVWAILVAQRFVPNIAHKYAVHKTRCDTAQRHLDNAKACKTAEMCQRLVTVKLPALDTDDPCSDLITKIKSSIRPVVGALEQIVGDTICNAWEEVKKKALEALDNCRSEVKEALEKHEAKFSNERLNPRNLQSTSTLFDRFVSEVQSQIRIKIQELAEQRDAHQSSNKQKRQQPGKMLLSRKALRPELKR